MKNLLNLRRAFAKLDEAKNSNKWETKADNNKKNRQTACSVCITRKYLGDSEARLEAARKKSKEDASSRTSSVKHRTRWVSKEGCKGRVPPPSADTETNGGRIILGSFATSYAALSRAQRVPCEFRRKNNERGPRRFAETDLPSCCIVRYITRECKFHARHRRDRRSSRLYNRDRCCELQNRMISLSECNCWITVHAVQSRVLQARGVLRGCKIIAAWISDLSRRYAKS